jgi:hypothetical protein
MNLIEIKPHAWGCSFLHVDSFLKRCNEHSQSSMSSSQPDRAFPTSDIRFTRIDDLSNGDVHDFIRELEQACGIRAVAFTSLPLMHFLMQCLYPTGDASKRVPISTAHLAVAPALDSCTQAGRRGSPNIVHGAVHRQRARSRVLQRVKAGTISQQDSA